ncbi:MAG: GDP-mannose 4,6-dehydratase [Candidatus Auribacterota bacterium]|jgi:CDP-paratose 2-epimerase|nr:GDP-mannose 4,6-dehydratase [Candidatus Auribacterota bacterium]
MKWFITGGAGFIGSNTAKHLLLKGCDVVIFDNMSRRGSRSNMEWLEAFGTPRLIEGDVRNREDIHHALSVHNDAEVVLHLAAQVAVTTSVVNPREDFEINALGTFNLLESIRQLNMKPVIINASTNKVYGSLSDIPVRDMKSRYCFADSGFAVNEKRALDFHSPYGCSKGCADQYMNDYSRIYGMRIVNFRQSCIYGYRQFGIEDQGWIAWFMIASMLNKQVTIYGNGKQVRDVLFVDDLVDAYERAVFHHDKAVGQTYNIGGGIGNTLSLIEFTEKLESMLGRKLPMLKSKTRPGDQPIYISDITKLHDDLNWKPKVSVDEGLLLMYEWVKSNVHLFKDQPSEHHRTSVISR